MKTLAHRIENAITLTGKFSSWSMAVLLGAIVIQVLLRYAFGITNTRLEDSLWYLFSATLVLGLSYTMTHDGHVRVDFVYQRYTAKTRRIVDFVGIALFLLPMYAFLMWHGWDYAVKSFSINESSPNPGGMPWLWIVKGLLPVSCLLLIIESLARLVLILLDKDDIHPSEVHGS